MRKPINDRTLEYAVKIGLPLALLGTGVTLFFGPYFWWGVVLFYSGLLLLTLHIAKQAFVRGQRRRTKIFLRIIYVVLLLVFSLWLFRPAPIELQASSSVPVYGPGSDINGIQWHDRYAELHLMVHNPSEIDYDNLDIEIATDLTFEALRQTGGLASCTIAPAGEAVPPAISQKMIGGIPVGPGEMIGGVPAGPADTSGEHYKAMWLDANGRVIAISGGINQTYRIRCEKFPANNRQTFIAALSVINPIVRGKLPSGLYAAPRPATRFSAKIGFTTLGRPRAAVLSDCKIGQTCKS